MCFASQFTFLMFRVISYKLDIGVEGKRGKEMRVDENCYPFNLFECIKI